MPLSLLLTLVSNIISKTEDDQNQDSDNGNDAGTGDDQNASPGNGTGDDQNASPGSGDDQGDDNDGGQQSGPTQTNLLMKRLRDKTSQQGRDLKDQQATIAEKDAEIQRLQAVIAQSAGNNASAAGNDEGTKIKAPVAEPVTTDSAETTSAINKTSHSLTTIWTW